VTPARRIMVVRVLDYSQRLLGRELRRVRSSSSMSRSQLNLAFVILKYYAFRLQLLELAAISPICWGGGGGTDRGAVGSQRDDVDIAVAACSVEARPSAGIALVSSLGGRRDSGGLLGRPDHRRSPADRSGWSAGECPAAAGDAGGLSRGARSAAQARQPHAHGRRAAKARGGSGCSRQARVRRHRGEARWRGSQPVIKRARTCRGAPR
jgi:hypothetical protein